MDVVVARCAGLDVHRDTVVATVRWPGKRKNSRGQETRTYPTTQRGLAELSDWLLLEQVELVGMEATGDSKRGRGGHRAWWPGPPGAPRTP